jgi:hypothetical protein
MIVLVLFNGAYELHSLQIEWQDDWEWWIKNDVEGRRYGLCVL